MYALIRTLARRLSVVGLVVVFALSLPLTAIDAAPSPAKTSLSETDAQRARVFIRTAALPSGALASHPDKTYVNPYLANLAVRGLATSRDPADRLVVFNYLRWYASNSPNGFADEYRVTASGLESTNDVDAQDSTAATFLSAYAGAAAGAAPPEVAILRQLRPAVRAAIDRIVLLQDIDGLTWAKASWHVKYLMDQVEVFWGLSDIRSFLADDPQLQLLVDRARRRLAKGIGQLWQHQIGLYAFAKHADGTLAVPDRTKPYPDAASQLWVGATKLVSVRRLKRMLDLTSGAVEEMMNPARSRIVGGASEPTGYWPLISVAYRRVGRAAKASAYDAVMNDAILASGQSWPYHVGIAGLRLSPPVLDRVSPPR